MRMPVYAQVSHRGWMLTVRDLERKKLLKNQNPMEITLALNDERC